MHINRFWICGVIVAVGLAGGIAAAIQGSAMEYVTVKQLQADPARYRNLRVKTVGTIVAGTSKVSTDKDGQSVLEFEMKGEQGALCKVWHRGPKPDAFKDGGTVILEGGYDRVKNLLRAETLLAKCPSRYKEKLEAGEKAPEHDGKPAGKSKSGGKSDYRP